MDAFQVVRRAYDLSLPLDAWLESLASDLTTAFQSHMGTFVGVYRVDEAGWTLEASGGVDEETRAYFATAAEMAPAAGVHHLLRHHRAFSSFSEVIEPFNADMARFWEHFPCPLGPMRDFMAARAGDGGAHVMMSAGLFGRRVRSAEQDSRKWEQITPHLAAALRLRRAFGPSSDLEDSADAVLSVSGELEHAEQDDCARSDIRSRLRDAVVHLERARTSSVRMDNEERLRLWSPLVAGRWTLVDQFDRGQSRYWVAIDNEPYFRSVRALNEKEHRVANQAAMGLSNGEIAFAMDVSPSQVSSWVSGVLRKLGLERRTDLPLCHYASVSGFLARDGDPDLVWAKQDLGCMAVTRLTPSEQMVAVLAMQGQSDEAIAKRRGTSVRTVANQMRSIFRKLEIQSRLELARRLLQQSE